MTPKPTLKGLMSVFITIDALDPVPVLETVMSFMF
jgi:hypothetical protein